MKWLLVLLFAATAAQAEHSTLAQDIDSYLVSAATKNAADDWSFDGALYLWASGIDGTSRLGSVTSNVDVGFDDLLEDLEGALLIAFEASTGRFGIFFDLVYMKLGPTGTGPLGVSTIKTDVSSLFLTVGGRYRWIESPKANGVVSAVDLTAGFRFTDFDVELTPAALPGVQRDKSWFDGFVGVRGTLGLSEKWNLKLAFQLATGGSDLTWQLFAGAVYRFSDSVALTFGYRWLDIDYVSTGFALDATFSGPLVGLVISF